jgi:hypothetical protein
MQGELRRLATERVLAVLRKEPELPNKAIAERCNCSSGKVAEIRRKHGFPPPESDFFSVKDRVAMHAPSAQKWNWGTRWKRQ